MTSREQQIALRESHLNATAEKYFAARPVTDERVAHRLFADGFNRGFDAAAEAVQTEGAPPTVKESSARPDVQPRGPSADADGEAFRAAARLGLTLRFDGGVAQSASPGTPSAYEVVSGQDRAAAMRQAVSQATAVVAAGGESHDASMAKVQAPALVDEEPTAFVHWPLNGPPRLVWYSTEAMNAAVERGLQAQNGHVPDLKLYAHAPCAAEGDGALLKAVADRLHAPGYLSRDQAEKHAVAVLETIAAHQPQPKGTSEYAEVDDKLLTGQAQHLISALMNHGLLPGKTLPEDKYLKLWDVVKAQLRCVHREAVRAAQSPAPEQQALTRKEIRALADATVREHGMLLALELQKGENFSGDNLVALLEVFAERLLTTVPSPAVVDGAGATQQAGEAVLTCRACGSAATRGPLGEFPSCRCGNSSFNGVFYAGTQPAVAVPLTEEQIVRIYERPELAGTRHESGTAKAIAIARAIERAHGIGVSPPPVQKTGGA